MAQKTLSRLARIHASLDRLITSELSARFPDGGRVARLKKLKLKIKDRLHRLSPVTARYPVPHAI